MNRDDIIRMVDAASGGKQPDGWGVMLDYDQLERFAALVVAQEREACAKVCDELGDEFADANPADCAAGIRARG